MASARFDDRPVFTLDMLEAHDPHSHAGGRERRFLCPLPACADHQRGERHRSLALNVENGLWTCHRCGAGGQLREHWPSASRLGRARSVARRAFAPSAPPRSRREHEADGAAVARALYAAASQLAGAPGAAYLAGRGLSLALAVASGVRFHSDFYGRSAVLFPLLDRSSALVAVNGRYLDGRSNPKVRTAGRKALGVFATPGAFDAEQVVICEAPIDALSLATCGVPAIALCGTTGPDWLAAACAFRRVALAFDADGAGDRAAAALAPSLRSFGATVERWRPDGARDWNELLVRRGIEGVRSGTTKGEPR